MVLVESVFMFCNKLERGQMPEWGGGAFICVPMWGRANEHCIISRILTPG